MDKMFLRFISKKPKRPNAEFECLGASEVMLFQNGLPAGWLLTLKIQTLCARASELIDGCFGGDVVIELCKEDERDCLQSFIAYTSIHSISIEHTENGTIAEIQLKRSVDYGD